MPFREDHQPLYDAYQLFEERCLTANNSLLWPDKNLWTLKNLNEFKGMYYDNPIEGSDLTFENKLEVQLNDASPEIWGIVADVFYLYTLPSSALTFEKKQSYIKWAAEKAHFQLPLEDNKIWKPLEGGFVQTGIQYHIKFGQILLILLFSIGIKEMEQPEKILKDSLKIEELLDENVERVNEVHRFAPRDMRHALLYLKFPYDYESLISTTAKENIVKHYLSKLDIEKTDNLDRALHKIREKIVKRRENLNKTFQFYDLRDEWDPSKQTIIDTPPDEDSNGNRKTKKDPQEVEILHALKYTHNLILSGPPGTGKTYLANKIAKQLVQPQVETKLSKKSKEIRLAEQVTFYDLLAIDLYQNPKTLLTVPEIEQRGLIQARFSVRPVENPKQSIWGNLQTHTSSESGTVKVDISRRSEPYIFDKDENSKWFLTDSGKKYVEQNFLEKLKELNADSDVTHKPEDFIRTITFHQSFAYEDFIEGIRPRIGEEETGNLTYEITPGVFSVICNVAKIDPENKYVLIIDEINRGNISKIFGELITLLEDDKRGMKLELPYSKREFSVPENLFVIGTMNTADRSIALMDVALRRRFTFIEMMPRPDLLDNSLVKTADIELNLKDLMIKLNEFIKQEIDRNHQIGHSYFMRVTETKEEERLIILSFVWNHQIFPLLKEYFYSQHEKLISFLNPFASDDGDTDFENMLKEGEDLLFALNALTVGKEISEFPT